MDKSRLPEDVLITLISDPAFSHCLEQCLEEPEFISNFCRLYKVDLPREPKSALDILVDEATGYRQEMFDNFFTAFIPFVHRSVYLPLLNKFNADKPIMGDI